MNPEKLTLREALVVEGKYDAARLAGLVDGLILTTDGFAVYKDKAMQRLLRTLAAERGLILLTDSDAAGFRIRHFITGLAGAEHVLQAYVPAIPGKEPRKARPGREGLLGVEGVPAETVVQGIRAALASRPERSAPDPGEPRRPITYGDLYDWGLSGTAGSAERRRSLLRALGLPPRLSKKELVQVLNTLYTWEALNAQVAAMPPLQQSDK